MATKWCYNAATNEVFDYEVCGDLTDFPRGTFLAYRDYLITGIPTKDDADGWAAKYTACYYCKDSVSGKAGESCKRCGNRLGDRPQDSRTGEPQRRLR